MILEYDHVQILIPAGRLDEALAFYVEVLGFERIPKPAELPQDGAWLKQGQAHLHLSEAENFTPASRAHPAFRVDNFQALMRLAGQKGLKSRMDSGPAGFQRGSIFDPFGNRIELIQKI